MNDDDDRVAYLEGEDGIEVDEETRADLDELRALLADETLWATPGEALEDSIVAAIAAETADAGSRPTPVRPAPPAPAPPATPATVSSLAEHRARRLRVALSAAAAVIVLVAGGAFLATRGHESSGTAVSLAAEPGGAPTGTAHVKRFPSGWRIILDAPDLPRLDNGQFYEAWLKGADGKTLVPIGTFNAGADVILWAGVSPVDFPTLTVTRERADNDQASSGDRVLIGTITLDDDATS
jgi:Anti-sigma-K factor rskA, C-terminal